MSYFFPSASSTNISISCQKTGKQSLNPLFLSNLTFNPSANLAGSTFKVDPESDHSTPFHWYHPFPTNCPLLPGSLSPGWPPVFKWPSYSSQYMQQPEWSGWIRDYVTPLLNTSPWLEGAYSGLIAASDTSSVSSFRAGMNRLLFPQPSTGTTPLPSVSAHHFILGPSWTQPVHKCFPSSGSALVSTFHLLALLHIYLFVCHLSPPTRM